MGDSSHTDRALTLAELPAEWGRDPSIATRCGGELHTYRALPLLSLRLLYAHEFAETWPHIEPAIREILAMAGRPIEAAEGLEQAVRLAAVAVWRSWPALTGFVLTSIVGVLRCRVLEISMAAGKFEDPPERILSEFELGHLDGRFR